MLVDFTASFTAIQFLFVNLAVGVVPNETRSTCTSGVGMLLLELALLIYLTDNTVYLEYARCVLVQLWALRDADSQIEALCRRSNIISFATEATATGKTQLRAIQRCRWYK